MDHEQLWNKCVVFHGHSCGGLAIGFRAAQYAAELLGLSPGDGEVGERKTAKENGARVEKLSCTAGAVFCYNAIVLFFSSI